jgi:hypothetical protein
VPALGVTPGVIEKCPFKLAREPIGFRIPNCNFTTVLVKPHNHPSRFLSNNRFGVSRFGLKALRKIGEFYTANADLIERNRVYTLSCRLTTRELLLNWPCSLVPGQVNSLKRLATLGASALSGG